MSAVSTTPPLAAVQSRVKYEIDSSPIQISNELFDPASQPYRVICNRIGDLDAFVLDNVLRRDECEYLITTTEGMGYSFWNTENERKDFRNADTIEVRHADLADLLWQRILPAFDHPLHIHEDSDPIRWQRDLEGEWKPIGTNPRLLFARYQPDGHFAPHTDGFDVVGFDHRSMYSIVLFLNDCDKGGGTRFYKDEQREKLVLDAEGRYNGQKMYEVATVEPKAGRMVVFYHNILHQGVAVGPTASKYIIRSDVMYKRDPPVCTDSKDIEAFRLYQEAQELSNEGQLEEALKLFRRTFKMSPKLADIYGM